MQSNCELGSRRMKDTLILRQQQELKDGKGSERRSPVVAVIGRNGLWRRYLTPYKHKNIGSRLVLIFHYLLPSSVCCLFRVACFHVCLLINLSQCTSPRQGTVPEKLLQVLSSRPFIDFYISASQSICSLSETSKESYNSPLAYLCPCNMVRHLPGRRHEICGFLSYFLPRP
jgi:hypothetical protein